MAKIKTDIRIGTSGWLYYHWQGRFYPEDLPKSKWFEYYSRQFDSVELNNTFYRMPRKQTIKNWHTNAPENFLYAVKASRFITHIKRLNGVDEPVQTFYETMTLLKEKLGPVLFQLPPSMQQNLELLKSFLKLLPENPKPVIEFRNKSWFDNGTYDLLRKYNAAFCIHDLVGNESPRIQTSDTIYIRFHGTAGRYEGNYSDKALTDWAKWIRRQKVRSVFVYFNNDYNAYAVDNAKQLIEKL
jgi:uncharacterized protein YecE (DUF72 family)